MYNPYPQLKKLPVTTYCEHCPNWGTCCVCQADHGTQIDYLKGQVQLNGPQEAFQPVR
jgi:hypothetical protein